MALNCVRPLSVSQGSRSIGPFVAERFVEIVKMRNRLARLQGYQDFYDYKCAALATHRLSCLEH